MDYNKLKEINEKSKTIKVKDKDYVEVNQRILGFWELFPNGKIITKLEHHDTESCIFKAETYDGDTLLTTGTAYENRGESSINKYAYVENCETSAIGRALGILGIGTNGAIASADEVQHKIALSEEEKRLNAELLAEAKSIDVNLTELHKFVEGKCGIKETDSIPNFYLYSAIKKKKEALAANANAPASK